MMQCSDLLRTCQAATDVVAVESWGLNGEEADTSVVIAARVRTT